MRLSTPARTTTIPRMPTYAQAIAPLPEHERSTTLAFFRALGGKPDRWQHQDNEFMARALTWCEDRLELAGSRSQGILAARLELRRVRRALEAMVEP
jgi:hypothetical protein